MKRKYNSINEVYISSFNNAIHNTGRVRNRVFAYYIGVGRQIKTYGKNGRNVDLAGSVEMRWKCQGLENHALFRILSDFIVLIFRRRWKL